MKLLVPVVIETHPNHVYYGEAYVESNAKRQHVRGLVIEYPVDVAARYVNHALQAVCLDGVLQDFEGGETVSYPRSLPVPEADLRRLSFGAAQLSSP